MNLRLSFTVFPLINIVVFKKKLFEKEFLTAHLLGHCISCDYFISITRDH